MAQVFEFSIVRLTHEVGESIELFRGQEDFDE